MVRNNYWRRRDEDFIPSASRQSSDHWQDRSNGRAHTEDSIGGHPVTGWADRNQNRHRDQYSFRPQNHGPYPPNPFQQNNPFRPRDEFQNRSFPPYPPPISSKIFKEYLIDCFNQILRRIQQWYPDEDILGVDGMDWQPEPEFVIPQPTIEVHYAWDPSPSPASPPKHPPQGGRERMFTWQGAEPDRFSSSTSSKEKVPSEGHVNPGWERGFAAERQKPTESEPRGIGGFEIPRSMPDVEAQQ